MKVKEQKMSKDNTSFQSKIFKKKQEFKKNIIWYDKFRKETKKGNKGKNSNYRDNNYYYDQGQGPNSNLNIYYKNSLKNRRSSKNRL